MLKILLQSLLMLDIFKLQAVSQNVSWIYEHKYEIREIKCNRKELGRVGCRKVLSLELEVYFEEIFHPDLCHIVDNVPNQWSRSNSLLGVSPN